MQNLNSQVIQGFSILKRDQEGYPEPTASRVTSQGAAQAAALGKTKYFPLAGQHGSVITAEDGYGDGT